MSDATRNEGQLLCDILGLESLVDSITFEAAEEAETTPNTQATSSAILGPFWRANAPILPMDSSIVKSVSEGADHAYLHGRILSATTGKPIENAELDIWETNENGLYEQQDDNQPDMNLRGRFLTDKEGRFGIYCLRPTSYPIPYDGPAGRLLQLLDRHPMRPAHIHFIVSRNHLPLT
jgi:catechol 1,2-dioxygenase